MVEQSCAHCGAIFQPGRCDQRFCSRSCKEMYNNLRRRKLCSECDEPMWGGAKCQACRSKCGTLTAYGKGCRCESCREAKSADNRRYAERHMARHGVTPTKLRRPGPVLHCSDCGKRIMRARSANPRCKPCLMQSYAATRRAATRRKMATEKLAKAACGVPANPRWPLVQGACAWCDETFTRRGAPSPYCSNACRRKNKGSGRQWITRRERLTIYERDHWVCQLCLQPVDPNLHYLDDWAASLDHIEPRALALFPDHSPKNLRLSHRWCNSVRGDGTHYTEEVLRVDRAA